MTAPSAPTLDELERRVTEKFAAKAAERTNYAVPDDTFDPAHWLQRWEQRTDAHAEYTDDSATAPDFGGVPQVIGHRGSPLVQ